MYLTIHHPTHNKVCYLNRVSVRHPRSAYKVNDLFLGRNKHIPIRCNFELDSQENLKNPIWIIVAFQQRDRQDSQNFNIDTFCRLAITGAQCIIGAEKYPDAKTFLRYDDEFYFHGSGQKKEAVRALTKDAILQPVISAQDFRSFVEINDVGFIYMLSIYDIKKISQIPNLLK